MTARLLGCVLLWLALAGAAAPAPAPLVPPPPDVIRLIPFATAPLDKPPVPIPELPLPPVPLDLPPIPPAAITIPLDKPLAPLPSPRSLPCVGAWLGIASESLECGRARFGRGEYENAYTALESAARTSGDVAVQHEARYWLGETLYRLGRIDQADWIFRQVAQDMTWREYRLWALHASGWTALRLADANRARTTFEQLLATALPAPLGAWSRHGLGLALYELGRYADAARVFADLGKSGVPPELARDFLFWDGDTAGRTGDYGRAAAELSRFTQSGPHPLTESGLARLGWWSLAGGRVPDGITAFRNYLAGRGQSAGARATSSEQDWVEGGLALGLLASNDSAGAQRALAPLRARSSPLALPVLLRLVAAAVTAAPPSAAHALIQEALPLELTPRVRAWLLLLNGELARREGNRDEARTQFDLANTNDPSTDVRVQSTLRLARANFEMREFSAATADVAPLLGEALTPELRLPALLLVGEGAYRGGDAARAAAAFRQVVAEFPQSPAARLAQLSIAWADLRQGANEEARRGFLEFARAFPTDPNTPDALVLASELSLAAGDFPEGGRLVEEMLAAHPDHPRAAFPRLNRALLMLRAGQAEPAQRAVREWLGQSPFPPLVGRAYAALGAALLRTGRTADARRELGRARREGTTDLAALGLGVADVHEKRWDEAKREFEAARDAGTAPVVKAAEYGLAVVAFHRGAVREFKAAARSALDADPDGPGAPSLLYVVSAIDAEAGEWRGALGTAKRLIDAFASSGLGDSALERIGSAAAAARAWPVVIEAYTLLRQRYPQSPFVGASAVTLAEAQLETGRAAEARPLLEAFVTSAPGDPRVPRALILLARAREGTGDAAGALDAYSRASSPGAAAAWTPDAVLDHARLLAGARRWGESRAVLERLVASADPAIVARAARAIGEAYEAEGERQSAIEWDMTAAYTAPESDDGRRALLAAAKAYAALNEPQAAAIVYRKLLAQANLPADLAQAARQGLAALPR